MCHPVETYFPEIEVYFRNQMTGRPRELLRSEAQVLFWMAWVYLLRSHLEIVEETLGRGWYSNEQYQKMPLAENHLRYLHWLKSRSLMLGRVFVSAVR